MGQSAFCEICLGQRQADFPHFAALNLSDENIIGVRVDI